MKNSILSVSQLFAMSAFATIVIPVTSAQAYGLAHILSAEDMSYESCVSQAYSAASAVSDNFFRTSNGYAGEVARSDDQMRFDVKCVEVVPGQLSAVSLSVYFSDAFGSDTAGSVLDRLYSRFQQ